MPSKKKGTGRSRTMLALVMILIGTNVGTLYYFLVYKPTVPAEDVPLEIADLTGNPEDYIGKMLTVSGYYVIAAESYSMLVENPLSFLNNSLDPTNYVLITGNVSSSLEAHVGLRCSIKGTVELADEDDGTLGVRYVAHEALGTEPVVSGSFNDKAVGPEAVAAQPHIYDKVPQKYAVLYSGGIKPEKAYSRYWNDMVWMYYILLIYGYSPDHIYVIYKDGTPEHSTMPVDYPATHASLDTVFGILNETMTIRDSLFFYTTNHGGSGGISTWGPMDSSGALTHSQVSNWLNSVSCDHMIIVMEQCVSGKFIQYLSAVHRVILTAASIESSYGCDTEGNWDEFVYHFMSAMLGWQLNSPSTTVDADYNNNGFVDMREAFAYAAIHDSQPETPLFDDDGDGVGLSAAGLIFSSPGYGATITL